MTGRGINRRRFLALTASAMAARVSAAGPDTNTLTLQSSYINDAEFLGYFVAIDRGYYRSRGIELTYRPGGPDIIPESALFSQKADIALTDIDTTVSAITRQGARFRIIGAQFQRNPMGVISLPAKPVHTPKDLAGKTLSVSPVSMALVRALFKFNGLSPNDVRIVPDLQSDPTALLTGVVDAALGFVSDYPFVVQEHGQTPITMLLGDYGMPQFIDVVVVSETVLNAKRAALVQWLAASRQGWDENFRDPSVYPKSMHETWLKLTGRSIAYDTFSNLAYRDLMSSKTGVFSMSEDAIAQNIEAVGRLGLNATRAMFDTTLLQEIR
jgi:ABC-type nitrate/sulfonate/bicarbonate transport system substrate-binding protein